MEPKKRAERTLFNTELMPWLEEDEIPSDDPLDVERRSVRPDIVYEDRKRFMKLCKKVGWQCPAEVRDGRPAKTPR